MSGLPTPGTTSTDLILDGAVWTGAEIDEVALETSSLRRLRGAGGTWTRSTFVDCALDGADLAGVITTECALVRCTLDGARLTGSQWLRSRWRGLRATDVVADALAAHSSAWTDVTFTGCRLTELDLSDARLQRVRLVDCDLSGARFAGARCSDVELSGCTLEGVTGVAGLRGARLAWSDGVSALASLGGELGITIRER